MQLEDLVIDDRRGGVFRVHRSAMTAPEILTLERERIFDRCWLYVGHESEIPSPGHYRRRTIAGRSVISMEIVSLPRSRTEPFLATPPSTTHTS